ncbi:disulfide oxidoreductase [Deinococcus cellulosilyticus]|uniref:Probable disulfide formation protein n=1 Tax=Deinococcus cellulosilyticus (strain DSM 18568 / NBRC 106333 / KACC 11606 / 5516J-15) TaxID=1223518 RepID=A0A511N639_DEIC1|nr:disulfide oxidoreductase [Deinococcus cellulosilyticus]GEM47917.1 hypothetical protein DC3_35520 [Deinococcus cellulosilyticus NBRC 106333 = KACC 11606]
MNIANRLYFSWLLAIVGVLLAAFTPEVSSYLFKPLQAKWLWLQLVCLGFQVVVLGIAAFQNWGWVLRYSLPFTLIGAVLAVINLINGLSPAVFGVPAAGLYLSIFVLLAVFQVPSTERPEQQTTRPLLGLASLTAVVATLGSLYYSEIRYFVPCTLCWYQRILMYPLAVLLPLGLLQKNPKVQVLALPLSIMGMLIATYHVMEEKIPGFSPIKVCAPDNPCTTPWVNYFGWITIPVLSLTAFVIIIICIVVANRQARKA